MIDELVGSKDWPVVVDDGGAVDDDGGGEYK